MNRRGFLMGLGGSVLAAPAIVRAAANLMPIRSAPAMIPFEFSTTQTYWIDVDAALREYIRAMGVPRRWLKPF